MRIVFVLIIKYAIFVNDNCLLWYNDYDYKPEEFDVDIT